MMGTVCMVCIECMMDMYGRHGTYGTYDTHGTYGTCGGYVYVDGHSLWNYIMIMHQSFVCSLWKAWRLCFCACTFIMEFYTCGGQIM